MYTNRDKIEYGQMFPMFAFGAGTYKRKGNITSEEENFIKNSYLKQNSGNKIGDDYQVLDNRALLDIKEFCLQSAHEYFNNLLNYTPKLKICSSWVNRTDPGEHHHLHKHPNSIISGVYYLENTNDFPLVFSNPSEHVDQYRFDIKEDTEFNVYNSGNFKLSCESNSCVVFPSYMWHKVDTNRSNYSRYSIAFNLFVESGQTIGGEDSATVLHL